MAKPDSEAGSTIETLLQQRIQYEQWLARLDATNDKAPAAVRDRVRGDYEARLQSVIDELRGHAATITQELDQHRDTQSRLDAERRSAEEVLAEAELRYSVGEYIEEEWQRLNGESQRHLDQLRDELQVVDAEITRLAEVQTLIGAPARKTELVERAVPSPESVPMPVPVAETPAPRPAPVAETLPPRLAPVAETPVLRSAPAAKPPSAPARQPEPVAAAPVVDELAFLKSVSDEEEKPAAPRRPSNSGAAAAASAAPAAPAAAPSPGAGGKTSGMAKTLKCNECGTFNRPTEWYCERCGAELAAL